jgi:IclR family transcriptional regulator, pca regulon regulatory protein
VKGSLERGIHVLWAVARAGRPVGLSELAQLAGLDKATTYRLARTLVALGCLEQDPDTREYRVGIRVLDFGFAYLNDLDVRQRALPHMQVLSRELGYAVSLSALDGGEVVYLEHLRAAPLRVASAVPIGFRIPANCSSMGKAMLAWLPQEERARILRRRPLDALTSRSITDPDALGVDLDRIRRRGFAINDEEAAFGLRSVASAVRDGFGRPVAAINVAVPASQVSLVELEHTIAPRVVQTAGLVSSELGFREALAATG